MEQIYVYCFREQALFDKAPAYFKIGRANDLEKRTSSTQAANARPPNCVFALGPFLDNDEAEIVESQAHRFLSRFGIQRGRYRVNPLEISEFREWISAQIIPICVYEKNTCPRPRIRLVRTGRRSSVSLRRSADAERGDPDLLEEARH